MLSLDFSPTPPRAAAAALAQVNTCTLARSSSNSQSVAANNLSGTALAHRIHIATRATTPRPGYPRRNTPKSHGDSSQQPSKRRDLGGATSWLLTARWACEERRGKRDTANPSPHSPAPAVVISLLRHGGTTVNARGRQPISHGWPRRRATRAASTH